MNGFWQLGARKIDCTRPRVMAIVNATPDSFFAGSRVPDSPDGIDEALGALLESGPDIVDIGGQSTRPGSERVAAAEELRRVLPVITRLRELAPQMPLTIDTYSAEVARGALGAGVDGVNDISGGTADAAMPGLVAEAGCGYVLMHIKGTPESMQNDPHYEDCAGEVFEFLARQLAVFSAAGVSANAIALDPGIGFGKRLEDNLALITESQRLLPLGRPLLYGVSRKSFIGRISGENDPAARLPGTLGVTWRLLDQGVMLHRVHDVAAVKQLFAMWEALEDAANQD